MQNVVLHLNVNVNVVLTLRGMGYCCYMQDHNSYKVVNYMR